MFIFVLSISIPIMQYNCEAEVQYLLECAQTHGRHKDMAIKMFCVRLLVPKITYRFDLITTGVYVSPVFSLSNIDFNVYNIGIKSQTVRR